MIASTRLSYADVSARVEALHEQDLVWYFLDAFTELQPPSNFGRMVAAIGERADQSSAQRSDSWHIVTSTGSQGMRAREEACEADERLLKVAAREYPTRRALAALHPRDQEVLTSCVLPRQGGEAFGARAALAPLTRAARQAWLDSSTTLPLEVWLVNLSKRATRAQPAPSDRILAAQVAREALGLWRESMAAYSRARAAWMDLQRADQRASRACARARVEAVEALRDTAAQGRSDEGRDVRAARTGCGAANDSRTGTRRTSTAQKIRAGWHGL